MFETWIRACIRYRIVVLAATAVAVLASLASISRLQVVIDPATMLPPSHPYVQTRPLLENTFREKYALLLVFTPKQGSIHDAAFLQKIDQATRALARLPGVVPESLISPTHAHAKVILGSAEGFEVRALADALGERETFERWLRLNPALQDTLVSRDHRSMAIIARFDPDPKGYNAVLARVDRILAGVRDDTVEIRLGGHVEVFGEIERHAMRMLVLMPLAIVLIGLVHFEAFRSWQGMVLPLLTAVLALVFVLGLFGAAREPLDVFNSVTPILVLAVAAAHAVQILKRYTEEYARLRGASGLTPAQANVEAIVRAMVVVGPLMIAAGVIAALGFFSLMVFEMRSVKAFGAFTGLGILSAIAIELSFIPALRSWLAPPPFPSPTARSHWPRTIARFERALRWPGLLPCFAVLLLVAGVGASRVRIDNSNRENFAGWTAVRQQDDFINREFAGTHILFVVVDTGAAGGALDPRVLGGVDAMQRRLEREPQVGKTLSLADYLRRMNRAMFNDEDAHDRLPDSSALAAQYLLLYENSGDAEDLVSFVDESRQRLLLKVAVKRDDTLYVERLVAQARRFGAEELPPHVRLQFGGGLAEAAAINEVLARDKLLSVGQILLAVFVLSGLYFRSVVAAALVALPLVVSILVVFGILGWFDIPLNIPTSMIAPMAVGIGADYAIYLLARLREEAANSPDDAQVFRAAFAGAGTACLYVATAIAAGYGVLFLSFGFLAHQWIALLIISAMVASALSTLLLVSWLVLRLRPAFVFGRMEWPLPACSP